MRGLALWMRRGGEEARAVTSPGRARLFHPSSRFRNPQNSASERFARSCLHARAGFDAVRSIASQLGLERAFLDEALLYLTGGGGGGGGLLSGETHDDRSNSMNSRAFS